MSRGVPRGSERGLCRLPGVHARLDILPTTYVVVPRRRFPSSTPGEYHTGTRPVRGWGHGSGLFTLSLCYSVVSDRSYISFLTFPGRVPVGPPLPLSVTPLRRRPSGQGRLSRGWRRDGRLETWWSVICVRGPFVLNVPSTFLVVSVTDTDDFLRVTGKSS